MAAAVAAVARSRPNPAPGAQRPSQGRRAPLAQLQLVLLIFAALASFSCRQSSLASSSLASSLLPPLPLPLPFFCDGAMSQERCLRSDASRSGSPCR